MTGPRAVDDPVMVAARAVVAGQFPSPEREEIKRRLRETHERLVAEGHDEQWLHEQTQALIGEFTRGEGLG